ncbi:putative cellobiose ABC transporter permease protein [Actinoplanes missouriensis 431]|uniref:Putative cellobiose ABC transporter permease protein n=1 Tax=Actinoplanes missouriensis (strain ATCC 14538 / DSM 43046 / CBS 188.64 / JCM 3121 / NBRC 102363 / NCIMB 12654 / NRRL B-3342 / UNCC 431) TaxID=512565 RepID=I0HH60_ACTM4|nr:sugar ABC transporter permease [Actinoplanes missouriensis]BAL92347.1 putative cellobiose ABC transporter permease protein [Actinoplanes missouriensis 431]
MSLTQTRPAPPGEPKHAPPPRSRYWWYRFDTKTVPYLLIAPFFLLFAVFGLFPIIFNAVVSLRNWRIDEPDNRGWAGGENFSRLLTDDDFWNALGNTFGIFVLSTIPQLLIALIVANLLNRKLRATTWWRVGILLPYVTPVAASTLVFAMFFARDYGLANWFLSLVGFGEEDPIDWRAAKWSSWIAIATMVNWKWIGYNALLYLSAMQSIPKDVYEAAAVDGAGPWTQLWRITVPMIQPVILFTVVLSTIGGLQLFNEPMLFDENPASASGGSDGQFQTIAQLIYKVGWKDLNLGYAAAMSWALFLIILIVAGVNALATRRLGGDK